jgi:GNAT superfamily N-acetyltransferase
VPTLAVTTRPARPSDAETLARTARLGMDTWRAFAPAGWTPRPFADSVAFTRRLLAARGAWALLADIAGEPAGHCAMIPGDWDEPRSVVLWALFVRPAWWGTGLADRLHDAFVAEAGERGYPLAWLSVPARHARARRFYERREWRADTLLEENRGMPMAIYGRPVVPPADRAGQNRTVDASVRPRP